MEYPKPFMGKKELIQMGLTREYLNRAIATPGQTFAFKQNPTKKTSPYIFDTQGFEKWREKDAVMQNRAMQKNGTIA